MSKLNQFGYVTTLLRSFLLLTAITLPLTATNASAETAQKNGGPSGSTALAKIPFDTRPDNKDFAHNCRAITDNLNKLMGYAASSCEAKHGVVMIKASARVHSKNQMPGFYGLAFGAAGWAVNEDYYGGGAQFVVGNDNANNGCLMLLGSTAAFVQDRIKSDGKDMQTELLRAVASAKHVECPAFLSRS